MLPVAPAIAIRAADENVAQELHLNFLKTRAAATFALADTGVEAEGAGIEAALFGLFGLGEHFADVVERADIDGGIGARGFAENGLIHEHHPAKRFVAGEAGCGLGVAGAMGLGLLAFACRARVG